MKKTITIIVLLIISITTISAQSREAYFIENWTDSISAVSNGKTYTIKYMIKKYDVGPYVEFDNEEPDHSNPSFCLWTVTVLVQNFETMLKFGAIEFTSIKDNNGSQRGQTADDFLLSWYADPSIINTKEFELASFKNCLLNYKCRLVPDTELEGQSKKELTQAQNISIFTPNDYEKDDNNIQNTKYKYDTFSDNRNGKTYKTLTIGSQVWMAENLAYNAGSGCWAYDDNIYNVQTYGYLYNWETAKNVCPSGWHLPSKQEFETLLDNYGGGENWNNENYLALIPSGASNFSALFGGWRSDGGYYGSIYGNGYFWSASVLGNIYAWRLNVNSYLKRAGISNYYKSFGFSVRCVKD